MLIYSIAIAIPAIGFLVQQYISEKTNNFMWIGLSGFWLILIGFRHEVGCDWEPYSTLYHSVEFQIANFSELMGSDASRSKILETLYTGAPGYTVVNWISALAGLGIYGVNTICAIVVIFALNIFCRKTASPWLAWFIATPYFLIVVAMGYSRQAVALGFLLWALTLLIEERKFLFYIVLVLIAASFHKWAFLIGAIVFATNIRWRPSTLLILLFAAAALSIFAFKVSFQNDLSALVSAFNYHNSISAGADFRVFFNALPAIIFLFLRLFRKISPTVNPIWAGYAILSVIAVPLSTIASTALDRMVLYLIPFQFFAWPYLVNSISIGYYRIIVVGLIALGYLLSFILWIELSNHTHCWIPYLTILSN